MMTSRATQEYTVFHQASQFLVTNLSFWVCFVSRVEILKRPAQGGEKPCDTFKGTTEVNAPALYALMFIHSFAHRYEWDEMYVKGNGL